MPSRFQLRGHSMEGLRWQLFDTYGARARIIRAERIRTGGLFGLGASTSYEVTVEVDGGPPPNAAGNGPAREQASRRQAAVRRGLADLLADADADDDAGTSSVAVATRKPDFGSILERLTDQVGDGPDGSDDASGVPRPSRTPGHLIVLVGLREQPLNVAWSMIGALGGGAELRTAGDHRANGVSHVFIDSVEVKKAQALAAVDGKPLVIAFSVGKRGSSSPSMLASVKPDQVWLVVDAAHKPEDTAAWVGLAAWHASPDALAVVGSTDTATPETVNELGYPVGWVDGYQSTSTVI